MKGILLLSCGAALACLSAAAAATATHEKRAVVRAALQATVSKDWDTVSDVTQEGCPASIHSVGRRVVKLHSVRPTTIVVAVDGGRASYPPAAVRFVRIDVTESGEQTTRILAPCSERVDHIRCSRSRVRVDGATFRFFRSARNEISFKRARLPEPAGTCPDESPAVRSIRPGLHQAQGELSEAALFGSRTPEQTALASAEVTSELDGDVTGKVVERVNWALKLARR